MITSIVLIAVLVPVIRSSCPPGFVRGVDGECGCEENSYGSLVSCNQINESMTASVFRGTWIGNYTGQIMAGVSPYLLYSIEPQRDLPSDWKELNEDNFICAPLNRQGVLCGQCSPHYGPAIGSTLECIPCSAKDSSINWLIYLALEFLPMTVFFSALLFFDIRTTSGPGNAFIFYAQMITTTFDMWRDNVLGSVISNTSSRNLMLSYRIPYSIWNLEFFSPLAPPYCLSPDIGTFTVLFMKYVYALYPLLLIVTFSLVVSVYDRGCQPLVCLLLPAHRGLVWLQRAGRFRISAVNAFAVFLILSYTKFVLTAFNILATNSLYDAAGNEVFNNMHYYDSTISYLDPLMVALYIVTLTILIILGIVLPVVLSLPSLLQLLYRLTNIDCFSRCMPWGRMQEFLQQFHGCYKDGCNDPSDYRCFSSLFLILRAVMFCVYSYTPNESYQYVVQTALCILVIFLLSSLRPFKRDSDNILNIGVFCLLGFNSTLMTFNYYQMIFGSVSVQVFVLQYLFTICPLVIVCLYFVYRIGRKFPLKFCIMNLRSRKYRQNHLSAAERSELSPVHDVTCYQFNEEGLSDFLDFTEASGRLKSKRCNEESWEKTVVSETDKCLQSVIVGSSRYGSMTGNNN